MMDFHFQSMRLNFFSCKSSIINVIVRKESNNCEWVRDARVDTKLSEFYMIAISKTQRRGISVLHDQ